MSDLKDFLLARIAEDERRRSAYWHDLDCARLEDAGAECDCGSQARVLAECAAKRRIIDLHEVGDGGFHERGCPTLRLLATVYADHPDYREEWRARGRAVS